jgi:hypothetical protein
LAQPPHHYFLSTMLGREYLDCFSTTTAWILFIL